MNVPAPLPAAVDLLIVGAGTAGTAAAFRASELGIRILVVDRSRVLSQLAEWASHQPHPPTVDADYGDVDLLPWPQGGPLVGTLPFQDLTRSDVLLQRWLAVYEQARIPVGEGFELTGWTASAQGGWQVELLERAALRKHTIEARHVLLACGSGVPAMPMVLGDPTGIATSFGDPGRLLGSAVCILGQGMSAAEAAVAITLAKAAAKDPSPVHWCWRGTSMPKVGQGKALGVRLLEAVATGLLRMWPGSEPLQTYVDERGVDWLVVRTERSQRADGTWQLSCLQFEKRHVVACLGTVSSHSLLQRLGVAMHAGPEAPQKLRVLVRGELESSLPGVFFAGSVLHPAYYSVPEGSPAAAPVLVDCPSHFRSEFCHGVRVAQEVARRLQGSADSPPTQRFSGPHRRG